MAIPTRAEVDAVVSGRLERDPDVRARLLDDPRAALFELAAGGDALDELWVCPLADSSEHAGTFAKRLPHTTRVPE
jgi:hypothetical protein